jgi:1,4-alpha-glucan branching enzyme
MKSRGRGGEMKRDGDGSKMKKLRTGKVKTEKAKMEETKRVETKAVFFSLSAPHAQHVSVAGDFNGWNIASYPMEKHWDGVWKVSTDLAPGSYEYRFFVDGGCQNDPQNVESVPNPFGSFNNVVRVK